jgi:hypothetical protein
MSLEWGILRMTAKQGTHVMFCMPNRTDCTLLLHCRLRDQDNKPPGLIGWWPEKAVTFVDNHDTGREVGP